MKEISFAKIDKVIKNAALPKTTMFQLDAGDEQIEVEVKTSLSLRERTDMAFEIADMIFPEDADAVYMPTFEQYAQVFTVMKYYTNIKADTNVERVLAFERATHILERVSTLADEEPVEIFADADNIVRFRQQCAMHSKKVFDQLGRLLSVNAADTAVSLDEILAALGKASEIDEERLARGVLQFRREEAAAEAPAESQPVILTKAEAE
nr:MAG TPA: hypothetical protein [Bacteriophage sp.]